jgi:hypothetical protein
VSRTARSCAVDAATGLAARVGARRHRTFPTCGAAVVSEPDEPEMQVAARNLAKAIWATCFSPAMTTKRVVSSAKRPVSA